MDYDRLMKRSLINHIKWLQSEIDGWIEDGVIQPEQGMVIRARYPIPESAVSWAKVIFSSFGAALVGLGVILLFAYNWETMHRFSKLAAIFISLSLAHGFGIWFSRSDSRFKPAGQGFHVMGTMLFGAGIWLIAQIYHLDEHYPTAFLAWGTGALLMAWALPSIPQGIIASLLLVIWTGCESFDFRHPNHYSPIIIFFGVFCLAFRIQSRALAGVAIPSFLAAAALNAGIVENRLIAPVLFFYACALIGGSLALKKTERYEALSPILSVFGYCLYLVILYLLTFKAIAVELVRIHLNHSVEFAYTGIPLGVAAVLWIAVLYPGIKDHFTRSDILYTDRIGVPVAMIFFLIHITGQKGSGGNLSMIYNLLFLFHSIMMIYTGCRKVSMKLTAFGCILLFFLAAARYVDLFESLIARAIVFFVIGGSIFLVGSFYSKAKKQKDQGGS